MNQTIGIKVIPLTILNGKLITFVYNGRTPSRIWEKNVTLEATTAQIIQTIVGLDPGDGYIEQLYTISRPQERDFDIAIVYYFLVAQAHIVSPEGWTERVHALDHPLISYATQRLRWKIEYTNVVYSLLPNEFVLGELQRVYEAILGRTLDKRNFRKKILSLRMLDDTGKKRSQGRSRPAEVYRFKTRKPTIVEVL
ncbi:MAG TPA: hypothetical protein VMR81_06345 [Patescibacteria group bacterium]|nr:hypothetical protein [Patescibacteria group bacterium]